MTNLNRNQDIAIDYCLAEKNIFPMGLFEVAEEALEQGFQIYLQNLPMLKDAHLIVETLKSAKKIREYNELSEQEMKKLVPTVHYHLYSGYVLGHVVNLALKFIENKYSLINNPKQGLINF